MVASGIGALDAIEFALGRRPVNQRAFHRSSRRFNSS
jgi:hypothetical protein